MWGKKGKWRDIMRIYSEQVDIFLGEEESKHRVRGHQV